MTQMVNKLIQQALGLDEPQEVQPEPPKVLPVVVTPPDLPVAVDNPALPDMSDIHRRQAEGEKQLEEMITIGREMLSEISENELPNAMPKLKRGVMEQWTAIYSHTLNAIIHKNKLQLEKKDQRLKEAGFSKKDQAGSGAQQVTNNMFFGSHEQMTEALKEHGFVEEED